MKLNNENFPYFADTTKLSFTRDEEEKTTKEINKMIDFIDVMNEVDTDNIKPLTHIVPLKNVFREDEIVTKNLGKQLAENAIENKDGYYLVSKTNMFGG